MHREFIAANLALTDYLFQAKSALDNALVAAAQLGTGGSLEGHVQSMTDEVGALWEMAHMYEEIRGTEHKASERQQKWQEQQQRKVKGKKEVTA